MAKSSPKQQSPKIVGKSLASLKDELQAERKEKLTLQAKLEYLSGRMRDLESDVLIRDKALEKLTQGTQLVEVIGAVKNKIRDDMRRRFENLKGKIDELQSGIKSNDKTVQDLTESLQFKTRETADLGSDNRLKDEQIGLLQGKVSQLEAALRNAQLRETQLKVSDKLTRPEDIPALQQSIEQVTINSLQEQLNQLSLENLRLAQESHSLKLTLSTKDVELSSLTADIDALRSSSNTKSL